MRTSLYLLPLLLFVGVALLQSGRPSGAAVPSKVAPMVCEAIWRDTARDRNVPVRIRMPAGSGQVPVILFSHGLGGSRDAGTEWAQAWVQGGFAVVHLQHPG